MVMGNIQGAGSMGGIGAFPPPPSRPLTEEQKPLVESTLTEYDAESLTTEDAKEILSTFREAGIRPGKELREAIETAGFDEQELLELGSPDGAPQGTQGPRGSGRGMLAGSLNSGLVRSGHIIDLSA